MMLATMNYLGQTDNSSVVRKITFDMLRVTDCRMYEMDSTRYQTTCSCLCAETSQEGCVTI